MGPVSGGRTECSLGTTRIEDADDQKRPARSEQKAFMGYRQKKYKFTRKTFSPIVEGENRLSVVDTPRDLLDLTKTAFMFSMLSVGHVGTGILACKGHAIRSVR